MTMLGTAAPRGIPFDFGRILASRWTWCVAVVLFLAARDLPSGLQGLMSSLGDTDDATRLHEVRALLAGTSWFDMTLPRFGGDTPLISHWSRLIDLPLAVLLQVFGLFLAPATAELATRVVWPLLLLAVFLRLLSRAAEAQRGRAAAWIVLALGLTCLTGLFQFRIGRIDHHNGMILGSIAGLLTLLGARTRPQEGTYAGILVAVGLAVGYEPLAFLLPALGLAALLAVCDPRWLPGIRNMAVALATTLGCIFLLTVAPTLWFVARCDALSLNMVLLAGSGAAALALIDARGRDWSLAQRLGVLAGSGVIGLALYGALDTRCLAGPFGQVDPGVKGVWLDYVIETANVFTFYRLSPVAVVAFLALLVAGLVAAVERCRRIGSPETFALLGLMVVIAPTGLWMIKLTPYASWVAVFCIALSLADLRDSRALSSLSQQLLALALLNQWTMAILAMPLLTLGGASSEAIEGKVTIDGTQCLTTQAISSLKPLPKGLFVGAIDFGSYIVALTHHDVLAAPYHRIDKAIIKNQAILAAEPAAARSLLDQVHADYVVLCIPKPNTVAFNPGAPVVLAAGSIEARLKAGEAVDYLAPVAIDSPEPDLRVWRVVR